MDSYRGVSPFTTYLLLDLFPGTHPPHRGRETSTIRPWDGEPTPLQLALARENRWLALLESGVDSSCVSRTVNLTTLAPDIVAAILDETLPPDLTLALLQPRRTLARPAHARTLNLAATSAH